MNASSPRRLPSSAAIVIMGGGFAGLSTAYALHERGIKDVLILEQEPIPAFHSSGRNAAMFRRHVLDPVTRAFALRSHSFVKTLRDEDGFAVLNPVGGLIIGSQQDMEEMALALSESPELPLKSLAHQNLRTMIPCLKEAEFDRGLLIPDDGVVDIHALTRFYLQPVKERFFPKTKVLGIEKSSSGHLKAVLSSRGRIESPMLVLAGGFGNALLTEKLGLSPLPFQAVRRHLFVTAPSSLLASDAPWVWNETQNYYFRKEGDGLLLSACDRSPWSLAQPFDPPMDPKAKDFVAEVITNAVPRFSELRLQRGWAGLRILTPDGRFVIGEDPRLPGLTWVAGLGGHGMTTSYAVGQLAADMLSKGSQSQLTHLLPQLSPTRFL